MVDLRQRVREQLARFGYDVRRITGEIGQDPFRDMPRFVKTQSPIVADVGANTGQTIERLRGTFEEPEIHSFEPSPATFVELERRVRALPGVHPVNCALGATRGRMDLLENTLSDMNSMLEAGREPWGEVTRRTEVEVTTLDAYAEAEGIERFHLLKSDTQGFDLEVLRGAERLLARGAVDLVLVEINMNEAYQRLPRLDEVCGFLFELAFDLVAFYNFHYAGDRLSWADAMFRSR